jgi:hypothetical protein
VSGGGPTQRLCVLRSDVRFGLGTTKVISITLIGLIGLTKVEGGRVSRKSRVTDPITLPHLHLVVPPNFPSKAIGHPCCEQEVYNCVAARMALFV